MRFLKWLKGLFVKPKKRKYGKPCGTCGFVNCICETRALPKEYSVVVYCVDSLYFAHYTKRVEEFLATRVIVKKVASRDFDRNEYHLIAAENEPEWSTSNEGCFISRRYYATNA